MAQAVNRNYRVEYILQEERGAENPTVFTLQVLNSGTYKQVMAKAAPLKDEEMSESRISDTFLVAEIAVKHGLKGWKNFLLEDGTPAPFEVKDGRVTDATFEFLPLPVYQELGVEIIRISNMGTAEKKP